jgi:hypothetical protein
MRLGQAKALLVHFAFRLAHLQVVVDTFLANVLQLRVG